MKFKKVMSVCALMFAFTLAACNGGNDSVKDESKAEPTTSVAAPSSKAESKVSSVAPSSKAESKASSAAPSSKAPVSSADPSADQAFLEVIPHTWTDGTPATNSDGKEYIPLTDAAANKVGVKISIQNFTIESGSTATGLDSSGKINPGNDHGAYLTYKVKAPKAGAYQLVLRGKSASNALERTLDARAFAVTLNGAEVNTYGDRTPLTDTDSDFVGAPTLNLTGNEDAITISASDYRIQFDVAGYIILAEH